MTFVGRGVYGPQQTLVASDSFRFIDCLLISRPDGHCVAFYESGGHWRTTTGLLLARLESHGPVSVLLLDDEGAPAVEREPCARCHVADGRLYCDDTLIAQLDPDQGWQTPDGRSYRRMDIRPIPERRP
jgi:hypothetical protein